MSTNNSVHAVLPVSDPRLIAKDQTVGDLKPGQLGLFDSRTNLSILPSDIAKRNGVYFALGYKDDGKGLSSRFRFSAGQEIQVPRIVNINYLESNDPKNLILDVAFNSIQCETEYAIKIEFNNPSSSQLFHPNVMYKSFVHTTGCCDECNDMCDSYDCNKLIKGFIDEINNDADNIMKAYAVDDQGVEIADLDQFILDNSAVNEDSDSSNNVCAHMRIEIFPKELSDFCDFPTSFYGETGVDAKIYFTTGFDCESAVATIEQELTFGNGDPLMVKYREAFAGGYIDNPGPYRVSNFNPVGNFRSVSLVDVNEKYDVFYIAHDNFSVAGWGEHINHLYTLIAVKSTSLTLIASLKTAFNAIATKNSLDFVTL